MSKKIVFPGWAKILYRGVRYAVVSSLSATFILKVDWTKPEEAMRTLIASFVGGFVIAFGMWLRDRLGETNIISKVMPI